MHEDDVVYADGDNAAQDVDDEYDGKGSRHILLARVQARAEPPQTDADHDDGDDVVDEYFNIRGVCI